MLSMAIFVERQSDVDRRQMERFLGSFSDCRLSNERIADYITPGYSHAVYLYKGFLGEKRLKQVFLLQIILDEEGK
jgi:hypothetical protein